MTRDPLDIYLSVIRYSFIVMDTRTKRTAAAATAVAIALLTTLSFQDQLYEAFAELGFTKAVLKPYVDRCVYALVSVVVFAVPAAYTIDWVARIRAPALLDSFLSNTITEVCNISDLDHVADLAHSAFGGRASSIDIIKKIYSFSPNTYWKITSNHKFEGYVVLYGLTALGEAAIAEGHFSGAHPNFKHIKKDIRNSKSICVSAVVGTSRRSRAAIINSLTLLFNVQKYERIYAKAITKDGLRLVSKNGFQRVDGKQVHELDYYYVLESHRGRA